MLKLKNVVDVEDEILNQKALIKDAQNRLNLLKSIKSTAYWFVEFIELLHKLEEDESIDTLKDVFAKSRTYHFNMDGLIGFDDVWLKEIQTEIRRIREKIIPQQFHRSCINIYNEACINDAKLKYNSLYTYTKKSYIELILGSLDSISSWCLHRIYVLDENPKFDS